MTEQREWSDDEKHIQMAVMGRDGDTKKVWDRTKPDEVEDAKRTFDFLVREKRYVAFHVTGKDGDKGEQMREFDPSAGRMILVPALAGGVEDAFDGNMSALYRELAGMLANVPTTPEPWPPGQYKVVGPEDLEFFTLQGWKLVFTSRIQRMDQYNVQMPNPAYDPARGICQDRIECRRYKRIEEPRFVLLFDESSLINKLTRELEDERAKSKSAFADLAQESRELDDAKRKLADAEGAIERLAMAVEQERAQGSKASERLWAVEQDVGKLRGHFGAKAFREVLGHD